MLRVSYTVRGARWAPLYDARLDSGSRERKPALELVRRAEIVQQTGEDWSDVALSVSTVRTAKGGSAPELRPLIVRYPQPAVRARERRTRRSVLRRLRRRRSEPAAGRGRAVARLAPAAEREAAVETGGYQVVFRMPGRNSVATSEGAKAVPRLPPRKIAPDLLSRATPALDETAFLEASFRQADEAPLLPGRVALYRDGIYVGRGQIALTPKDETVRLGFGADDKVKVARATVRKIEGSTGIISSAKTDEREYKITVRSGHERPIRIDGRGPDADQRERGHQGGAAAGHDAADRARRARPARRARLELRCRAGRDQGDQARLAHALAGRQGGLLRAAPALITPGVRPRGKPIGPLVQDGPMACLPGRHPLSTRRPAFLSSGLRRFARARPCAFQGSLMANVVVVGSQWGDEGKGKIVDWLSEQADVVVRFQGGHNAGHTLVIDGTTYKLSLLPSGVVRPGKLSVIGNGVVLDPRALLEEIGRLASQGVAITPDNLRIAENVALILPLHRELDTLRETSNAGTQASARPSAASVRPMRTRSAAARSA